MLKINKATVLRGLFILLRIQEQFLIRLVQGWPLLADPRGSSSAPDRRAVMCSHGPGASAAANPLPWLPPQPSLRGLDERGRSTNIYTAGQLLAQESMREREQTQNESEILCQL